MPFLSIDSEMKGGVAEESDGSVLLNILDSEEVKVLVGPQQKEFTLNRKLLCETSSFFREHLDTPVSSPLYPDDGKQEEDTMMWLPTESPEMFELFVLWLYRKRAFLALVDQAVPRVVRDASTFALSPKIQALRWNLTKLHIFAAVIDLPALQDVAMDALQDLYLRCDLDVSPRFLAYLYQECDANHAFRLRKWAVAMLAWSLHAANSDAALYERLFITYPALREDYSVHLDKMIQSKADVRIKNPQLRLPMNKLRSGERFFGFRLCSFHSHRASVGEAMCPHLSEEHAVNLPLTVLSPTRRKQKGFGIFLGPADGSDGEQTILSPVGDVTEISFLDLS
ncbi:hypothetical protein B0T14DRAFT_15698 [Immersiella caudata]|uniref:BTB domain-containing protein n=1 Tax=Immersiella caudata TaxID=314043 RepID=A0AA39XEI5_9PEZI|nr:hypothetical protein B0T14DRAFT_15698 [Immersiella caudata]